MPADLLALLDPDPKKAEERLNRLRDVLWRFFEWRGARDPEDLVHIVFVRGMEKINEGATVYSGDPGGFFYGIARNVLLEASREARHSMPGGEAPGPSSYRPGPGLNPLETKIYLNECLARLDKKERELLTDYATGGGMPSGVSVPALRLRAHRIRKKLSKLREK